MKSILYSCAFVPAEWILAHGFEPLRAVPPSCSQGPHEGLCPFVRGLVRHVESVSPAAVILTTVCDQMRRAGELLAQDVSIPVFLLHVPAVWQQRSSLAYYRSELERLGAFLCELGGEPSQPETLKQILRESESRRREDIQTETCDSDAIPLALVGGELLWEDREIFQLVRQAGGQIVLDATDQGPRSRPGEFRETLFEQDPLAALAEAYFGTIPHAFRRPNDMLYTYLNDTIYSRGVRGILFRRYPWCDTWNAELTRLRNRFRLPFLDLDSRCDGGDANRQASRIEAFLEVLT